MTAPSPRSSRSTLGALVQPLRWSVGIGALAWVIKVNGGWTVLRLPVEHPIVVAAFVAQVFLGAVVEAQRLRLLCAAAVTIVPFGFAYRIVAVATLFNIAIPGGTGGDVLKLVHLAKHTPGRRAEFTALLFLDRLIGLTSLLLVALVAAAIVFVTGEAPARTVGIVVMPALLLLCGVLLVVLAVRRGPRDLMLGLIPERWTRLHGLFRRAFDTTDLLRCQPRVLMSALGISMLGQGVLAIAFAVGAVSLLPGASPIAAPAIAIVGLVVNAIPITPGGIGIGEAAFEALFQLAGHRGGARLLLFWRLGQVPFAALGAWVFMRRSPLSGSGGDQIIDPHSHDLSIATNPAEEHVAGTRSAPSQIIAAK